jgi:hypothetical protein
MSRGPAAREEEGGNGMAKYMLLIYGDEVAASQASDAQMKEIGDAYEVFTQSIRASGNYVDGDPFQPTTAATTVQVRDGKTVTGEGPADVSKEQLTAYYKVEADGPEQAIEMASRIPGAQWGTIEVRPVMLFD